jgi:hypothetical protein
VQIARHFGQSPHQVIFSVVILLLTFAAGSTFAGEPQTILALNPIPEPSFMELAFGMNSLYFNPQNKQTTVFSINIAKTDLVVPVSQIESQTNSLKGEALLQIREISRSSKPITVEAGYGQIWDDKSTLQKICSDYQDPSYAYVSAHFSF